MTEQTTYSQEQLNTVAQTYMDEIIRLQQINANHKLTLLSLRQRVQSLTKELADLKLKKTEDPTK